MNKTLKYLSPLLIVAVLIAGCNDSSDEIKQYRVARVNDTAPSNDTQAGPSTTSAPPTAQQGTAPIAPFAGGMPHPGGVDSDVRQQMLAAIVPHPQRAWFFKLVGPADKVGPFADAFNKFIASVMLSPDGANATWTLPNGWTQQPGEGMRYATIIVGDGLDMTVIPLAGSAGDIKANVDRWCGQLGLPTTTEQTLPSIAKSINVSGVPSVVVNLLSPEPQHAAAAAPMNPHTSGQIPLGNTTVAPTAAHESPIKYTLPAGWVELPAGGMRLVSINADGAEVTVIALPTGAGDVVANVNRWRGQVGIDQLTPEQIQQQVAHMKVGGSDAVFVDLVGPESAGPQRHHIVAAMLPRGDQIWFFKLNGNDDVVSKNIDKFKQWLSSVKF